VESLLFSAALITENGTTAPMKYCPFVSKKNKKLTNKKKPFQMMKWLSINTINAIYNELAVVCPSCPSDLSFV